MKLFSDGAAADNFSPFENHWLESALGEIKRRDKRIVTAADECYSLSDGHVSCGLWQNDRRLVLQVPSRFARHFLFHFLSGAARRAFSIPSE